MNKYNRENARETKDVENTMKENEMSTGNTIVIPAAATAESDDRFDPQKLALTPGVGKLLDLERLRLDQDFDSRSGVKKALITVPVRKPGRQEFIRVHPDPAYTLSTLVLEFQEDRETYLLDPAIAMALPGQAIPKMLVTTQNRQGVTFLWPLRLPGSDGRLDSWSQSALEAAELAKERWIRLDSNMSLKAYEVYYATGELPDPQWPEQGFQVLTTIAFKGRYIQSVDDPVLRRLRGEV